MISWKRNALECTKHETTLLRKALPRVYLLWWVHHEYRRKEEKELAICDVVNREDDDPCDSEPDQDQSKWFEIYAAAILAILMKIGHDSFTFTILRYLYKKSIISILNQITIDFHHF